MLIHRLPPISSDACGDAPPLGGATGDSVLDPTALARLRELDPSGTNQLIPRVVKAFETSLARLMPQLDAARANGDLEGVRRVAHTLKSSSASIGALKLSSICAEIETTIRTGNAENVDAKVDAMGSEVKVMLQALSHLLDTP